MNDTRSGKKELCQQIQVFVRIRPINNSEKNDKCTNILEIPNDKEVIIHERPYDKISKKFKFNSVFGPSAKQINVYNVVVNPLLEQVLAGYNCTVFAYGQTGTGKTFTMEGINKEPSLYWHSDSSAGMIPRSLSHLFDKLQALETQEYTVRVSFLELYNEDIFDLLSNNHDASKLRLYEDASKKGAVIVHGLEEVTIHNTSEVYKILKKGSDKRQTAATFMNTQSSRSHTIFSITVHMKESTIDGEEILKTGKLNLVDLAGSENVGRSGSVDKRAREAGNINQSLLTLGRVITALVERAPHIPYRESKLTRLLQESLGGRTKTSIIATVSPANINLEETLSTLDYAHRAKNITNRPEINQKLSKREFLKQYTEEIEKLRRDLLATRERNGVYLADDNFKEMQTLISQQNKEIEEKINHIKALEKIMQDKEKIFNELESQNIAQMKELNEIKTKLNNATDALQSTYNRLKLTIQERDEQKYLTEKYMTTEQSLLNQAQTLVNVVDTAITDSYRLHDKIERKSEMERKFEVLGKSLKNNVSDCLQNIKKDVFTYGEKLKEVFTSMKNDLGIYIKYESIDTATNIPNQSNINNLKKNIINESYSNYQNWIQNEMKNAANTFKSEHELMSVISLKLAQDIDKIIENEIAKNLKIIRNNISEKLKQTSISLKEMIDSVCIEELKSYNHINKNVKNIIKNIEILCKKQEFSQKQQSFIKMLKNVFSQFNELKENQEKYYCTAINNCDYVSKICNEIGDQATTNFNINTKMMNDLIDYIENDIEKIESNIIIETKKNEEIANRITTQGKDLINELKSNVNESYNVLKQYNNIMECNIKETQLKMDIDKNMTFSLIDDAYKIISDANKNHIEFVRDKKIKISDISQEISIKLENQIMDSCVWNNNFVEQLQMTDDEINKFFDKDVQRDISTGLTPARKNFSYPRQFVATSPHEKILKRFRETTKIFETIQDDYTQEDMSMNDETILKQIANSTALSDVTFVSSGVDNTTISKQIADSTILSDVTFVSSVADDITFTASIFNNDDLSKHTSSSDSIDSHIENVIHNIT
ncbi:kinesin-like protein Klp61F isoform X1 [Apis dorsata]|uniref:kinesin-like protein Klp61F isoform X1 n=1 Tax=Apis dorsata TaxID=7462 RepID=UPI0003DF4EF5|nr:kinesin-like protein Klp61F isoform X1 [Apis dorsata]